MKKRLVLVFLFAASAVLVFADGYYSEAQVYQSRPRVDREMPLDCIGATGIKARFYPGVVLKVEGIIPGAPAEGKFKAGQIITGVNGVELKGINPIVALGKALTAAEASDGKMVFHVKDDATAVARHVTVNIPVVGTYSTTWPIQCDKSKAIIAQAAEYYAKNPEFRKKYFNDKSENGGVPSALACLFLLSTGDDQYVPVVKEYFANFPKDLSKIGDHTWNNGYNGIACAEYYLRTGDKAVLPILQYYCDNAKERQYFGCGWQHWGRGIHPRYVAGGLMNPAGAQVLTTLLLGKVCGVNVDDDTLLGALKFWYRFVGHGTVPYGDHRGEGGLGSNGKDGMSAAAMRIAARAKHGAANYERAMKHLSMATLTSYPSLVRGHADEGRGDGIWRGVASAIMLDYKPKAYHAVMNDLRWWYDLSRRPSGAVGMATNPRFDDEGSGAGVALAYTAPLKALQITGAPRSRYAVDFDLPTLIWGNEADLAFLSIENGKGFRKQGKEDPIHIPFFRYGSAYSKAEAFSQVPREDMLKNVCHKRYVIRAQAAKALREVGAFDELTKLLDDGDPRMRRAALDGMIDYRYWFHLGKQPMKPEQFTPGMIESVTQMLKDRKESLYVIDGALSAMSLLPPGIIGENLGLIMPWTKHEEWWLRQSAFVALAGAAGDEALVEKVLPTMLEMLMVEDHTMPRDGMVNKLNRILQKHKATSPVGQQILAAHMKAVRMREIIPGTRAGEGEWDVQKSVEVLLKETPGRALELAEATKERFGVFSTEWVVTLANGLAAASAKAPSEQREDLDALLYDDFRQELIERMKDEGSNLGLIDAIIALTALRDAEAGWHALGGMHSDRVWRFVTVEPQGDDILHHREKKRFRAVALPDAMKRWYAPGFDDSKWKEGQAPIGVGDFQKRNVTFKSESDWGDDEFLLARTTFDVASLDFDFYRISVLANQGFDLYLNGKKIETYVWWKNDPHYRKLMLSPGEVKHLKKGTNHLAVFAGSDYVKDVHVGQIDVYLEGLKKSDFLGSPTQ
ncbi:MAG: hypothetical protein HN383_06190 [Verrucomicrobia bacterium]|jgi:hypothetical protein|nr:hypothetical protein [Verrucomicrobiota bacterium]